MPRGPLVARRILRKLTWGFRNERPTNGREAYLNQVGLLGQAARLLAQAARLKLLLRDGVYNRGNNRRRGDHRSFTATALNDDGLSGLDSW